MATMTLQDLINLQNQNPGASRAQLAAIWQKQGSVTVPPTPTPPPAGTPPAVSGGSVNPTPPPSPTGGGGGGGGGGTPSTPLATAIANYQASHPYSPTAFNDLVKTLQSQGYHISIATHAGNTPSADAIVDPQGNVFDLVNSAGDPGAHWQNISAGGYDPTRSVVDPSGNITNFADWSKASGGSGSSVFNPSAGGGGAGGGAPMDWGAVGQMLGNLGYTPGGVFAPWTQNWTPPTAQQALNYPGVQYAMQNSMNLMENSAAAQGVLGNARAQEAISQNLGQSLLGQYSNIRGMALGDYLQNQSDFFANQDRPFSKFMQGTQLGIQANQL